MKRLMIAFEVCPETFEPNALASGVCEENVISGKPEASADGSDGGRRSSSKLALSKSRQGASTIEFLTAGVLLATVMTFLVPFVGRVAEVNEEIADREWALREVRNVVVELQTGKTDVELSGEAEIRLEDPTLEVIRSEPVQGEQQQVSVSIVWTNRFGEEASPVTLSFWESPKETP